MKDLIRKLRDCAEYQQIEFDDGESTTVGQGPLLLAYAADFIASLPPSLVATTCLHIDKERR